MPVASSGSALALELERVRPNLPLLYQQDDTLWAEMKTRSDLEVVSYRPTRVPMELLAGGKFRGGDPNGGDLGRGSAPQPDYGTLVPYYLFQCSEWTKAAEINTDQKQKAIKDYVDLIMERSFDQFGTNMEALIQGDGSNTLDSVVVGSSSSNIVQVTNGNQFYDNQDIDVWSAVGGTFRGTVTIQSVDANNKNLYLTTNMPSGTTAGDLLLLNGSAGTANSGIFGIKAYQVNGNTGSVMNLARSSYPGKLSTPNVNFSSGPLTPAGARKLQAQMRIALGVKVADEANVITHWGLDMAAAWENTGLNVTTVIQNQLKGDSSQDMLKKELPTTFAGRKTMVSIHATPGRIDLLAMKHWFRVENQPIDFYEAGGQTIFPGYGASGGLQSSLFFYIWTGVNLGNDNVRAGAYASNVAIPAGY